jgi:hypothetical protein
LWRPFLTASGAYLETENILQEGVFMKGMNFSIGDFYCMHKEFDYLRSIHLYRDEEAWPECSLDIVLGNRQLSKIKMLIHFSGVINFESANLDLLYTLFISIVDVSENQMEGICYKVREDEHNLFSFWCKNFAYNLI